MSHPIIVADARLQSMLLPAEDGLAVCLRL